VARLRGLAVEEILGTPPKEQKAVAAPAAAASSPQAPAEG
jgi:hypothetical protein